MTEIIKEVLNVAKEILGVGVEIRRLEGGINNLVYVASNGFDKVLIKKYPNLKNPKRNRYIHEKKFLQYTNCLEINCVPRLINSYDDFRINVVEYIEGLKFHSQDQITDVHINQAIEFIQQLNSNLLIRKKHIDFYAEDGACTIEDHIDNIETRVSKFTLNHLPQNCKESLKDKQKKLEIAMLRLREWTSSTFDVKYLTNACSLDELILSPSDFGFHNAIYDSFGNVKFFDFEHAGLDEPAKLALDFSFQPRVQITQRHADKFKDSIGGLKGINLLHYEDRFRVLSKVLLLKWIVIILSIMDPDRYMEILKNSNLDEKSINSRMHIADKYMKIFNKML